MMEDRSVRILLVDGDANYRGAFAKYFAQYPDFETREAANGHEGLRIAKEFTPDLILSDHRTPDMDGIEFCMGIRGIPETSSSIFLILTIEKDEKLKARAFECGIDDYLEKTISPAILTKKIHAFLRIKHIQNKLVSEKKRLTSANETLEKNFEELTEILLKIIDLKVPGAADRSHSAKGIAMYICDKLEIDEEYRNKLVFSARLHEIGKIGLPDSIADKNQDNMVMNDRSLYNQHPVIGSRIISTISGFKQSADAIYHQYENFDGSGTPEGLIGEEISLGARILRGIVLQNELCRSGHPRDEIIREIRQSANRVLDPVVSASVADFIIEHDKDFGRSKCKIALDELKEGMTIAEDIYAASGNKLIPQGMIIQDHMIKVLMDRNDSDPIIGGVYVMLGKR